LKKTLKKWGHRRHVCSAEAAAVSVGAHVLLILLAGSLVAVRYVHKRDAEMDVVITRPKLERRQLQLPQKIERVRRTSRRPKMITTRAASSATSFSVPDFNEGEGGVSSQKFDSPFARGMRDFRVITAGIGIGTPRFKFLGVRGEGEKVVFILDASADMLSVETGGADACEYVRKELNRVVSELPSSVLFNAVLYDGETVAAFRPLMVPVNAANRLALSEWIAPVWRAGKQAGLSAGQNTYVPETVYETAIGDETRGWVRALQHALEQRPDTVFIVGRNWGKHSISREKGELLIDFSLWELLSGGGAQSVKGSPALAHDRELRDHLIKQAVEAVEEEDETRRLARDPGLFLRDLINYIQYSEDQIFGHIDAVVQSVYAQMNMAPPWIHFVRLVSEEEDGVADEAVSKMRDLTRLYSGEFAFLNGQDAVKWSKTDDGGSADDETEVATGGNGEEITVPESGIELFNIRDKGRRIAFVMDASEDTADDSVGGTNAFSFLRHQLAESVSTLSTGTLFNVVLSDQEQVVQFHPEMAAFDGAAGLKDWLSGIQPGNLPEHNRYESAAVYDSAVGADVQGLPLALQVALEQQADLIFVIGTGPGRLPVSPQKARRLLDFMILDALGASGSTTTAGTDEAGIDETQTVEGGGGTLLRPLTDDKEQQTALVNQALSRIQEEVDEREKAGLPSGFIHNIADYIQYTPRQIIDHVMMVAQTRSSQEEDGALLPRIHFAVLLEPDGNLPRDESLVLRQLSRICSGEMKTVYGADTEKEMRKLNRMLDLYP
jgi:hypothetical protein